MFVFSCEKVYTEPVDKKLEGTNTTLLMETRFISRSGNKLVLESDIRFVSGGDGVDNITITDSFLIETNHSNYSLQVDTVYTEKHNENLPYSHLILIDGANDGFFWFGGYNPANTFVSPINKTIRETMENPDNQIALSSVSCYMPGSDYYIWRGTNCPENPMNQEYEDLTQALFQNTENLIAYDYSYDQNLGASKLYDALYAFIDSITIYANNEKKIITVLGSPSPDELINLHDANEVIEHAQASGVYINIFCVDANNWDFMKIGASTGGYTHLVDYELNTPLNLRPEYQLAPVLASLHTIASKNYSFKRIRYTISKTGPWFPGEIVYDTYQTMIYETDSTILFNNPIAIYVKIP